MTTGQVLYAIPAAELARKAAMLGGLDTLVQEVAEVAGADFDKPETIPRPLDALLRALRERDAFAIVIEVGGEESWRVEVTR